VWRHEDHLIITLGQSLAEHGHQLHKLSRRVPDRLLHALYARRNNTGACIVNAQTMKGKIYFALFYKLDLLLLSMTITTFNLIIEQRYTT